jgi:hypothetical protein
MRKKIFKTVILLNNNKSKIINYQGKQNYNLRLIKYQSHTRLEY